MSTTAAMSLAEFLARPEEHHTEWSQGVMVVDPPTVRHQLIAQAVARLLDNALSPGLCVANEVGWLLRPDGPYRVPDVAVFDRSQIDGPYLTRPPVVAVELFSPDERPEVKLTEYAAAGLDHYWTFDLTTEVLTVFECADQEYVIRATATPGHVLHVEQPFPIDGHLRRPRAPRHVASANSSWRRIHVGSAGSPSLRPQDTRSRMP